MWLRFWFLFYFLQHPCPFLATVWVQLQKVNRFKWGELRAWSIRFLLHTLADKPPLNLVMAWLSLIQWTLRHGEVYPVHPRMFYGNEKLRVPSLGKNNECRAVHLQTEWQSSKKPIWGFLAHSQCRERLLSVFIVVCINHLLARHSVAGCFLGSQSRFPAKRQFCDSAGQITSLT